MLEIRLNKSVGAVCRIGRVFVKKGDTVHNNDALFTVESRKIQTVVHANFEGEITGVNLVGGGAVKPETVVMTVDGQTVKESKVLIANSK
ncbi:biotin/lipoyl-containing protein [Dehalobacter restrictus]|jgi:biotin carboxyl carrier protein|uniref:biotin/lipoyl-containing protein n=1 Tax=Dehalobacter restrictus TaxID=55583 RepID=UPI00338D6418